MIYFLSSNSLKIATALGCLLLSLASNGLAAEPNQIDVDFNAASGFASKFRTVTHIGGGSAKQIENKFSLDASSRGGNQVGVFLFDTSPGDSTAATQSSFASDQPLTLAVSVRAVANDSTIGVLFADSRNVTNQVMAIINLKTGAERIRFFRDGTLGARSQSAGTQVGGNHDVSTSFEPGNTEFLPLTITFTRSGDTPLLRVQLSDLPPVESVYATGDIDWANTLVLLRVGDADSGKNTPVEVSAIRLIGPTPGAPPATVFPPAPGSDGNLLTVNPGFESGSLNNYSGTYSFTGWVGKNDLFAHHALTSGTVSAGSVTEGTKKMFMSWGGFIATNPSSRPQATEGEVLELTFDCRTLLRKFPNEKLGVTPYIEFFDSAGLRLKRVWGPDWQPRVQFVGKDKWETFTVRATAPQGTASVGVFLSAPAGRFVSSTEDYTQDRNVEFDNVRLKRIPEPIDRIAWRRIPRLIEPGKQVTLTLQHATPVDRLLRAALLDETGKIVTSVDTPARKGRFYSTDVRVAPPETLPNGEYRWKLSLHANPAAPALVSREIKGVIADQTVVPPTINTTEFPAVNSRVVTMGRVEKLENGSFWLHWFGSEVRLRFSGTSLHVKGTVNDNGYGGAVAQPLLAIIDDNFEAPITLNLSSFNFNVPILTGLPEGIHTVRLFKSTESDKRVRLDAFRTDPGCGLLAPEPLSPRRLEIFGDSVTSGGSASPGFNGYAPLLGRILDADTHIVSKGGTGVSASFSGLDILLNYWDNLSFPNAFDASSGATWDFSEWTPHAVVIAIGHNDQFNGGPTNFVSRYTQFKAGLRSQYPKAAILSLNTLISANLGFIQGAVQPLIEADNAHRFAWQYNTWNDSQTAHPPTDAHHAMVVGDELRYSQAEIVEALAGWGIDSPLSGFEQWVTEHYSPAEIADGLYAARQDPSDSLLLRYALGVEDGGFVENFMPVTGLDALGRLQLTFRRTRPELDYFIETSGDLKTWFVAATNPGTLGQLYPWTDSESYPNRRFVRLRVVGF